MENSYGVGLYQDGVFYFTNPGLVKFRDEVGNESLDFVALWNNREYTFKGKTTVPLIIANEPPENVQHIRKVFAKKYATAWFFTTKKYKELVKKGGYTPAAYNEDAEMKEVIQACLTALPKSQIITKEIPRDREKDVTGGSKAIGDKADLSKLFENYDIPILGKMES